MCWNASVSLNTYLFSLFATMLGLGNGVISLKTFLFWQSFISMQLVEAMIWSHTFSNLYLSQIAFVLILLQPALSIINFDSKHKQLVSPCLALYALFVAVLLTVLHPWNTIDFSSIKSPSNGHLAWNWLNFPLYIIAIWLAFFMVRYIINRDLTGVWVFAIVCLTYILYHKTKTWGSLWCWIANCAAFWLVFMCIFKTVCWT